MSTFLSTRDLAGLAGVTQDAVKKALAAIISGKRTTWKGAELVFRRRLGRGGRSGWLHEIEVDSLPLDLQARFHGSKRPVQLALKLDGPSDADRAWKEALLAPALRTEPRTPERRNAVRAIVAEVTIRNGQRIRVPERTVLRWLGQFDKHGLAGLTRKKRTDAGRQAVVITRAWDAATTHLSDGVRKRIAAALAQYRRNLWGNGFGYIDVRRLASEFLADATADVGTGLTDAELRATCELPKHVVEVDRDVRDVHEFRTDRKSWDDKRPRKALTSEGLAPMQIVYGDVHHFDIYLERADGSKATPKGMPGSMRRPAVCAWTSSFASRTRRSETPT